MVNKFFEALSNFIRSHIPHIGFGAVVAGITAISQSQDDFNTLFGPHIGAKVYVLAKWFGSFCMAIAGGAHIINAGNQEKP